MSDQVTEKHLLAGLDERQRGFSRQVEIEPEQGRYHAAFRYETTLVGSAPCGSQDQALKDLVQALQDRGYRQLRSRLTFRAGAYLGSLEPWVEYEDPVAPVPEGLLTRLQRVWQSLFSS